MRRHPGLAVSLGLAAAAALALAAPAHAGGPQDAYYANDADGIFWFMHISDLHVGCSTSLEPGGPFPDPDNLIFALNDAVDVIQPVFVVATGDLVNGSANNIPTSGQSQGQWDQYKSIFTAAQAAHPVPYYDIVGNHDEYAMSWDCPSLHWYLDNSYRGPIEGAAHFSWSHTTTLGDYFFYALNATGDCVPAFTGGDGTILDTEYDALKTALEDNDGARLRFVFAHQGPAQPTSSARVVTQLVQHGTFYLHGHIHEYKEYLTSDGTGEVVTNEVSTLGKGGSDNIAVGVVDHDAFIYHATSTSDPWPFVVITAPVSTRLRDLDLNPWAYDVCKDQVNPVRALVFAPETPTSVTVQVGVGTPEPMTQLDAHLWSAAVDTSFLAEGQQTVTVTALSGGKTKADSVTAQFLAGPCAPQEDAGVQQDAGGAADGAVDDGGESPDGGGADAGPGNPDRGCGCRAAGRAAPGGAGLLALAGLALGLRGLGARRRRRDRRACKAFRPRVESTTRRRPT